jgi:UDP-glucuronate 4-epimerase
MQTILVTGAAGFIGSHLTEALLRRGDRVIGVDNFDPFYDVALKRVNLREALTRQHFEMIELDCADASAVARRLEHSRFDVLVHLAAKAGVRPSLEDPLGYTRANVLATTTMLELARQRGVHRFVFGSSSSVYGDSAPVPFTEDDPAAHPISPYAATKRAGELAGHVYHHVHGMGVLCLRLFTVYGPRQRPDLAIRKFATLMLEGREITLFGDGSTERDYTWIDDIVTGVIAAIDRTGEHPGEFEVINLGGSRTTSLARLVDLISAALGVTPQVNRLPLQPGDVERTHANVEKAARLLGYVPRTSIEEGIARFAEWMSAGTSQRP